MISVICVSVRLVSVFSECVAQFFISVFVPVPLKRPKRVWFNRTCEIVACAFFVVDCQVSLH